MGGHPGFWRGSCRLFKGYADFNTGISVHDTIARVVPCIIDAHRDSSETLRGRNNSRIETENGERMYKRNLMLVI